MTPRAARRLVRWAVAFGAGLLPAPAPAQLELRTALSQLDEAGVRLPPALLDADGRVSVLAEYPSARAAAVGIGLVGGRFRPLRLSEAELREFSRREPDVLLAWSPPRHTQLDRARTWVGAPEFWQRTGGRGRGVVVGVVDTGVDLSHPDLRNEDGTTRVKYLLDFSRPPADRQPELEAEFGCSEESPCAVFAGADVDELLQNGIAGDEPQDSFGHGTHVTSLAASNGRSDARFTGIAPEADLIVVRVSRAGGGSIYDADIVEGVRFVFERAEALGTPAVVNLSLGSDFGPHDGSSALERALASFVGPEHPGRAIVVAAGNSAAQFSSEPGGEPEPLGIHTEVHVARESESQVALLIPSPELGGTEEPGAAYIWVSFQPGDDVDIALDDANGGSWVPFVPSGRATTYSRDDYEASVFNGPASDAEQQIRIPGGHAVVVLSGSFVPGSRFTVRLRGRGTANLWVQGSGSLGPEQSGGVTFPRSEKQGTINIPAAHPDLIAVGATLNRTRWTDHDGVEHELGAFGALPDPPEDTTAYFSAAGPNALGGIKPDLVAPGAFVIGAMSRLADPRTNGGNGAFAANGACDNECFVVDDFHAMTSGTSMASPIVAGAVALLFEQRPELTQDQVRALLQAGARPLEGTVLDPQQVGPGALDVNGALAALIAEDSPIERAPGPLSRLSLAASYAHPDPSWPLQGLVELRDEEGRIADGFDRRRLELECRGGALAEPLTRVAAGLYRFAVTAPSGSGGEELTLSLAFAGEELTRVTVPIGVDRWAAEGRTSARGGCAVRPSTSGERVFGAAWALLGAVFLRRLTASRGRACTRSARTARHPDRTGARARSRLG